MLDLYTIKGISPTTGRIVEFYYAATSAAEARSMGHAAGLSMIAVTEVGDGGSSGGCGGAVEPPIASPRKGDDAAAPRRSDSPPQE